MRKFIPHKEGLLMFICEECKEPMEIPPNCEMVIFFEDYLVCSVCDHKNEIDEELRDYTLATRNVY